MPGPDVPHQRRADSATGDGANPEGTCGHRADPGTEAAKATAEPAVRTPEERPAGRSEGADAELAAVVDLLLRALRALGGTGQVDPASRLAGRAWSVLRTGHPRAADRVNGLLHYLARLPAGETPPTPTPSSKERP